MNSHHHEEHQQGAHGNEAKRLYTDPICGMSTEKEGEFIRHEHDGRSYYFCSGHCLEKFKQDPQVSAKEK